MGFSMSVFQIIFLLMSTYHIEVLNSSLVGKSIEGLPPGTLHNVITFKTYSGGFFTKEYCLNIQAVKDNEPGELFIVEKESDCEASLMNGKKIFQLAFYNFQLELKEKFVLIKADKERLQIPLINKKYLENKKFTSHIASNSYGSFEISTGLGGKKREWLSAGSICYQTDDECNVIKDNCQKCPYGTYYIKNNACAKSMTKVCGIDQCGTQNNYACIRGPLASEIKEYCLPDSPYGFCHEGLRVSCVNKVLICE